MSEVKTGLGHQYKADEKAFESAKVSLSEAMMALKDVRTVDALDIRIQISQLMDRCSNLSYAANEAYRIND